MNDDRKTILEMLAAGKITANEAERLLAALDHTATACPNTAASAENPAAKPRPKYLRVLVDTDEHSGLGGPTSVNVRVPMQLLRAGVRLAGLVPAQAHDQVDQAFRQHGVPITLSQIKPENLEEIIDHLDDLTVDVDGKDQNKTRVRVFCE